MGFGRAMLGFLLLIGALVLLTGCFVTNSPPVASFTFFPFSGTVPLSVSFNASSSYDSDGSIAAYEWDFGDGGHGSGVTTSHTYSSAGTYTVRLKVTDNDGATATVTHSILVQLSTPTPSPSSIDVRITASESEIKILDYKIEHSYLFDELVGHAKNITAETFSDVFIKARMYDSNGVVVDTDLAGQSDIAPQMTFEFTLFIWKPESTATIEIYKIDTYSW